MEGRLGPLAPSCLGESSKGGSSLEVGDSKDRDALSAVPRRPPKSGGVLTWQLGLDSGD